MSNRTVGLLTATVAIAVMSLVPSAAAAQQQQPPAPVAKGVVACDQVKPARTKQPLTALPTDVIQPKRTPDGWPDLQGTWSSGAYPGGAQDSIETGWDPADRLILCEDLKSKSGDVANLLTDPMHGLIPYQPWAKAKQMEYLAAMYAPAKRMDLDVDVRCFARGVPRASAFGGFELRYVPGFVVMTYGSGEHYTWRLIPMDGRPHLSENVKVSMGDSSGHWEDNTLVVETTNNRDGTWFDKHATFHSEDIRVVERWTMVDQDTMYYEATIEDPTVFTRPWKMAVTLDRNKRVNRETQETTCHEGGERFIEEMVRAGLRARAVGLKGYHIHVDLVTGKAIRPEEQKYLDESGQPLGTSYAPLVPDEALPKNTAAPSDQQSAAPSDKK
jgi:hypothetical protein